MKTQVAAIEFGTSKIVTLIAQSGGLNRCDIVGSGTVPYDGYMDGDWNTPEELMQAVNDSVAAAELEANSKIREIYIGVPGEYIHIASGEAELELDEGAEIDEEVINKLHDMVADKLELQNLGGLVMHRSPAWFAIDDGKKTMMPMGAHGKNIKASISYIVADPQFVDDMKEIFEPMGVTILGFLAPSLGEIMLLLTPEDRDRSAAVIDVGYLNTEISVVEGDAIVYHAILPLGGGIITADLCEKLQIPMRAAEQIKRGYVFNPDEFDQNSFSEVYDDTGARLSFPREYVQEVVEVAMDDVCADIDLVLKNEAVPFLGPRMQIFLTGGGISLMRGGREYLAAQIGMPVKAPVAKSAKLNSPVYASALGLVDLIFDSIEQQPAKENSGFSKLGKLFNK